MEINIHIIDSDIKINIYHGYADYEISLVNGKLIMKIDGNCINKSTANYDEHYYWILSAYATEESSTEIIDPIPF